MNFLYPSFLWALLLVAIPIIIHLFNFRRYKTVYFSNVKYLKNIKKETKSKSQLKHFLILLARILTIIFLVLAFAQPYKPAKNKKDVALETHVVIYIDNSFSMDAESEAGNLFNQAKNSSFQILNSFSKSTKFHVLTNDFRSSYLHPLSHEKVFDILTKLEISSQVRNISDVYARATDLLSNNKNGNTKKNNYLFLISDFQKSSSDLVNIKENTTVETYFIPIKAQQTNNLYIDSVYFDTPSRKIKQAENINIKLLNKSDESYQNIPIKLMINEQQKALSTFSISAHSSTEVKLAYTNPDSKIINGKIEITDYPITFDNQFFFSYLLSQKIKTLQLFDKEENKYINALLNDNDNIEIKNTNVNKVSISDFQKYNLIIINELQQINSGISNALKEFVFGGGTLLVLPGFESDIVSYNNLLKELKQNLLLSLDTQNTEIKKINTEHEIYKNSLKTLKKDAKLPIISTHFKLSKSNKTLNLLTTKNNSEILTVNYVKKGKVYLSSIPFSDETDNFVNHKIFVPTLFNIALYSQNTSTIYYILGENNLIEIATPVNEDFSVLHVQNSEKKEDFIPEVFKSSANNFLQINVHDNVKVADNYSIIDGENILGTASFNYNRIESEMEYFSEEEIQKIMSKISPTAFNIFSANDNFIEETLSTFTKGNKYWKYFLALALLFIAIEILLIRLRKLN